MLIGKKLPIISGNLILEDTNIILTWTNR